MLHGINHDRRLGVGGDARLAPHHRDIRSSRHTDGEPSPQRDGHAILLVDDDLGMCETIEWTFSRLGFNVRTARSGAEGIARAMAHQFDLMMIDLRLPDMEGTAMIHALRHAGIAVPFILMSALMTSDAAGEATKLGAIAVIEKPVAIDELSAIALAAAGNWRTSKTPRYLEAGCGGPSPNGAARPRSAAERWARHVLRACESEGDLKTLADWAKCVGVSYSSMRESCRLLDIQPRDARDLVRVLRAVIKSRYDHCAPNVLLDVSDSRTLGTLMNRAGMSVTPGSCVTVKEFLLSQRFIARENEGLRVLEQLLGAS
jgi:CheY-like chemotaxis protein